MPLLDIGAYLGLRFFCIGMNNRDLQMPNRIPDGSEAAGDPEGFLATWGRKPAGFF